MSVVDERAIPWVDTGGECWTHGHVLRHCEGFLVDGPERHLGFVSEVLETAGSIELLVAGPSGTFTVPLEAITSFDPRRERIVVARVVA
jgi:hypothetical protein